MTEATSLTARWYASGRSVEAAGHDHEERPYWRVEGVTITVDGETLKIQQTNRGSYENGRLNVTIGDGELRFPLEDLVPLILERFAVRDLAEMICADQEARSAVLDALAHRYNEMGIGDSDRRYWIAKTKESIHDKALDTLTYSMTRIEHAVAQLGYRAMADIAYENVLRHELRERGIPHEEAFAARYPVSQALVDLKPYVDTVGSGKDAWEAARDFWREQTLALFRNVEVITPEPSEAF